MIIQFLVSLLVFPNLAVAAECKALNTELESPIPVFKQLIEHGEKSIVIWPQEQRVGLGVNVSVMIARWIEKFVRHRSFEKFELEENMPYVFPIQKLRAQGPNDRYASIRLQRQTRSNGLMVFTLSDLTFSASDEFLKQFGDLSRGLQKNWVMLDRGVQVHPVLLDQIGGSPIGLKKQMNHLFKNPEALFQIKKMPHQSDLILQSESHSVGQVLVNQARRFLFHKNSSGAVFLLACTIYK